jgi:hypothetical protein
MQKHLMLACAGAVLLLAGAAVAEQAKPATPAQAPPAAPARFVPPIRGVAELGILPPASKRVGKEVVTVIKIKNLSTVGSIAGLKVDEFWYNKAGDPITGDSFRYKKPLLPGEVIEVTLKTPIDPKMDRNSYNFTHANGNIKTKRMKTL